MCVWAVVWIWARDFTKEEEEERKKQEKIQRLFLIRVCWNFDNNNNKSNIHAKMTMTSNGPTKWHPRSDLPHGWNKTSTTRKNELTRAGVDASGDGAKYTCTHFECSTFSIISRINTNYRKPTTKMFNVDTSNGTFYAYKECIIQFMTQKKTKKTTTSKRNETKQYENNQVWKSARNNTHTLILLVAF